MTNRPWLKAVGVFAFMAFMAFLAAQAATGFMRQLFADAVYPRALRAIDVFLVTLFTGPFGERGTGQ